MDINKKIDSIDLKVRELALQMQRLQARNAALIDENKDLKNRLLKAADVVDELQNRLADAEAALEAKPKQDPEEIIRVSKKINHHLEEINRCIKLLGKK